MKIAVYSGSIPSTTFIENLIKSLAAQGHTVFLFGKQTARVNYPEKVKLYVTPSSWLPLIWSVFRDGLLLLVKKKDRLFRLLKLLGSQPSLPAKIKKAGILFPVLLHEPDVLHIQWGKTIDHQWELFEVINSKLVLSLRGTHINYSPLFDNKLAQSYRKYFPRFSAFHAVSKAIGREAQKYNADPGKIKVIYSPVRDNILEEFSAKKERRGQLKVISIGRFHWVKGYDYALDAMAILNKTGLDFEYTIVAEGNIPESILYLLADSGLQKRVKIINGLKHPEVIKLLKTQDVLLLSSVEEGIANVVLEAMAVGTPVISTDCGGMSEVISHGENGFLIPVRDAEAIANALQDFSKLPGDTLEKISIAAKKTIAENHSELAQTAEYGKLYLELDKALPN